ncbi:hypothetical protein EJ05DRAFT_500510 [Pseudovirgaria hyperparasitica]|uniref:Uncharacterized protein n=1 Tax=Pseudovirgaria hyperparasitica TaxID=470096 RepID=A0A6A6W8U0_9PEZI|nr:uncharacterized protein EJ05DRAFT_500510 [Pseudovirgaria hyperparasitica]KAF2757997.1 hypothetical protein EJ05DRAFT_500510 [Pseudovirgaria hyperparasitica]
MSSDLLEAFGNPSEQRPAAPPQQKKPASNNKNAFSFEAFQASEAAKPRGPHGPTFEPGKKILEALSAYEAEAPFEEDVEEYDEEEDFGDFEDAPQQPKDSNSPSEVRSLASLNQYMPDLLDIAPAASTIQQNQTTVPQRDYDSGQASSLHWSNISSSSPTRLSGIDRSAPVLQAKVDKIAPDPDVLFDAVQENDEDDDDFGDFEDGVTSPLEQSVTPTATGSDLLGLNSGMNVLSFGLHSKNTGPPPTVTATDTLIPVTGKQSSKGDHQKGSASVSHPLAKRLISTPKRSVQDDPSMASRPPQAKVLHKDEEWDDFADWEPTTAPPKPANTEQDTCVSRITSSIKPPLGYEPSIESLPPTNVPPPAVLLSVFPPLFATAQDKLFKPLAAQSHNLKKRILSDPAVGEFLRGYLLLAIVAARVIAGRKSRWKRDTHLSQGMRIGPASSRGTSGMKLTGVDKSETAREDRETLDVVRAWREQLGRLRSVVAGVNSVNPSVYLSSVPEIQEAMPVRIIKDGEGGITAPHQCALCGLKRNERVSKVDVDVDDSFGEWWIEKTSMHRACRNFWEEHHGSLRQR